MTDEELDEMSIEQLESLIADINDRRAALKVQAVEVHRRLDFANAQVSALRKLATLSDAEKALLVQMIEAQGAASDGAVGTAAI